LATAVFPELLPVLIGIPSTTINGYELSDIELIPRILTTGAALPVHRINVVLFLRIDI